MVDRIFSGEQHLARGEDKVGFIMNIGKLYSTQMGAERMKRNLKLEADDAVLWHKEKILKDSSPMKVS